MDVDVLARGLVAGWLADQVDDRGTLPQRVALASAGLLLIVAVVFDGGWRWLFVALCLLALGVFAAIWVVRWLALAGIRRFAEPKSLAGRRADIDEAIDAADLPTGPLAIARFLFRLRRGVGTEVDRIRAIVSELMTSLDGSEALDP